MCVLYHRIILGIIEKTYDNRNDGSVEIRSVLIGKMRYKMEKPILYIVIPCYNEEEVLPITSG